MLLLQPVQTLTHEMQNKARAEHKQYLCPLDLLKEHRAEFVEQKYDYGLCCCLSPTFLELQSYPREHSGLFCNLLNITRYGVLSSMYEILTQLEDFWISRLGTLEQETLSDNQHWLGDTIFRFDSHTIPSDSLTKVFWNTVSHSSKKLRHRFLEDARLICIDVLEKSRGTVYVSIDYCFEHLGIGPKESPLDPIQRTKKFNTLVELVLPKLLKVNELRTYWCMDEMYLEEQSVSSASLGRTEVLTPYLYDRGRVEFTIDTVGLFHPQVLNSTGLHELPTWLNVAFSLIAYETFPKPGDEGTPYWVPGDYNPSYLDVTIERID